MQTEWEEGMAITYGSVWPDEEEGRFRAWHMSGRKRVCYAESGDGLEWRKPALGVVRPSRSGGS